jgi:MFS family permease
LLNAESDGKEGRSSMAVNNKIDESPSPQLRLETLNRETREELIRADSKATTLFSVLGLILGALLAGAVAGRSSPERLSDSVQWLFWVGVSLALIAEAALCSAVLPRMKTNLPKEEVRFFVHVAQFEDRESLRTALLNAGSEYDRLVDQVYSLSKIIVRKYQFIRLAIALLALSVLCCLLSLVISHYTS